MRPQTALEALLEIEPPPAAKCQIVKRYRELIGKVNAIDPVVENCSTCLWGDHSKESLKDWATKFTQRRNKTIHKGDALAGLPDDAESETLLREVVDMADRVLRNAIRAKAALVSQMPPGEELQDALASPANNDYHRKLAATRAWIQVCGELGTET